MYAIFQELTSLRHLTALSQASKAQIEAISFCITVTLVILFGSVLFPFYLLRSKGELV